MIRSREGQLGNRPVANGKHWEEWRASMKGGADHVREKRKPGGQEGQKKLKPTPVGQWVRERCITPMVGEACTQKWWSAHVDTNTSISLLSQLEDRDTVRLHNQSGPLASAWMAAHIFCFCS